MKIFQDTYKLRLYGLQNFMLIGVTDCTNWIAPIGQTKL